MNTRGCLIFCLCGWSVLAAAPLQKKVLIIGVDGTMISALKAANTPVLNTLKAQGAYTDRAVNHPVTHSAACWTAMFTGVWGDKNGVNDINNNFYGPQFGTYPNFLKRLETVNSNWNTVAYLRWSPLSAALAGTDVIQSFGTDAAMVTSACARLTNSNPDVFYTILLDVDSAGHAGAPGGWGTASYVQAIETADARIGQIMNALTNRVSYTNEDWLVIIMSDHGKHDDADIEKSRMTFQLTWGPSAGQGVVLPSPAIVDVCATVLHHMEVEIQPEWNLDARLTGLPQARASYSTNLIFNGDAESNSGTNNYFVRDDSQNIDRGIAWWCDASSMTLGQYGSHTNFPTGLTNGGNNFFLGGLGASNVISQRIDLAHLAVEVDGPGVNFTLAGWFGGRGAESDRATLQARFLNSTGAVLEARAIGGVTPQERGNATGLLSCRTNGTLPAGTRLVELVLTATASSTTNDASADNLSLVLEPVHFSALTPQPGADGWEIGVPLSNPDRVYELWRSADLLTWINVTAPIPGHGGTLRLSDTNPPSARAFYRAGVRVATP